jgi:transposase
MHQLTKALEGPDQARHGVVAYLRTRVTNGAAEALNGIIQTVKRKARGFRTVEYFTAVIYLVASHLAFNLPNPLPVTHTKSP